MYYGLSHHTFEQLNIRVKNLAPRVNDSLYIYLKAGIIRATLI